MYLLLKHQPWWLKPIDALYVLLVGKRARPGLLPGLLRPRAWPATWAAFRGGLAGDRDSVAAERQDSSNGVGT